jgi:hypothetical protein
MLNTSIMLAFMCSLGVESIKNECIYSNKANKYTTMEMITVPKPSPVGDWIIIKDRCKKDKCPLVNPQSL